jgi:predicted ATPase/DNA-binding CsgD family transcriptional regulator
MQTMSGHPAAVIRELGVGRTAAETWRRRKNVPRTARETRPPSGGVLPSAALTDPTPLIDRERELKVIRTQLLSAAVRLVTLTGPGGIGKTRLALAAAQCVETAFPDGMWFVDLASLHGAGELDSGLGRALRLERDGKNSLEDTVTAYLAKRRLLLILDNFEHLLPASGRVAALLAAAPHLKVLVTSREPLNLRVEHRVPVAPLRLPDPRLIDPDVIASAPAAALFLEHARRLRPDFVLTPADAPALVALLHRLDGVPLAIQIVAGHSHVLSPAALLDRLEGQVLLSTEEAQDVPARHHTLRQTIDWSYGLLTPIEQAAFRRLGVFVGGWTLEAAEAVLREPQPASPRSGGTSGRRPQASAGGEDALASPAWAMLERLVDKSLVQVDASSGDTRRYRMLEPIREYALERLAESGERDTVAERHAAHYLELAEQATPGVLPGFDEAAWRAVEIEFENVLAALQWALKRGDGELSQRLAAVLGDVWLTRGELREGQRWLGAARALGDTAPPVVRARVLAGEGILAWFEGNHARAQALCRDALVLVEGLGDPIFTNRILSVLGGIATLQGNARDGRALLERGLAVSRQITDPTGTAFALIHLGRNFALQGDLQHAEAVFHEALNLARSANKPRMMRFALANLSQLKLRREDYAGAATLAAEALRLARPNGARRTIKYAAAVAALVSEHRGDVGLAARLLAAVEMWSDWGHVVSPTYHDPETYATLHARAREQLGEAAYASAVVEARALSVDQVAGLAQAALEPIGTDGAGRTPAARAGKDAGPRPLLSDREQAVLRMISEGSPNKQIATALGIAERTVKSHVSSAMNKLGVDNRAHAAVTAVQRGLL